MKIFLTLWEIQTLSEIHYDSIISIIITCHEF